MQRSSSMVQAGARNDNLYVVEQGNGDYLKSLVQENDVEYMRELYVWDKSPCSLCMGCFCDLMCHWNIGSRNTKWLWLQAPRYPLQLLNMTWTPTMTLTGQMHWLLTVTWPSSKMYLGNLGIASLANVHFRVWCTRYLVHKLLASGWGDGVFWVDQQLTQCLIWLETGADLKWRQDFLYCLWYMSHIWEDYSSLGLLTVSGLLAGGLGLASDELGQVSTRCGQDSPYCLWYMSHICAQRCTLARLAVPWNIASRITRGHESPYLKPITLFQILYSSFSCTSDFN